MVLLVAAMTVVIFGVAALVADLGQARVVRGEAQAASDSSALAAANALYLAGVPTPDFASAVQAAKHYAADNYGVTEADWAGCTDPQALPYQPAGTACISFDKAVKPSTVRVVAPLRAVNLVFGSGFGASDVDISAQAEASLKVDSYADCALCIVGFGPHDLQNGDAKVSGGSVAINGDVSLKANGEVTVEGQTNDDGTRRVRHDQHLGDRDRQHLHPGAAAAPAADRGPPGVDPAAEQPVLDHPEEQHQPLRDGRRPRSRGVRRLQLQRPTASSSPDCTSSPATGSSPATRTCPAPA